MVRVFVLLWLVTEVAACGGKPAHTPTPEATNRGQDHVVVGSSGIVWREGVHYQRIPNAPAHTGKGATEVVEFFSYGCPFCYMLDPHIVVSESDDPGAFRLIKIPAGMRAERLAHARLYYVLEKLGRNDLHADVFDSVWRQGNRLATPEDDNKTFKLQQAFAVSHGISASDFAAAYYSKDVEDDIARGQHLYVKYKIDGIPKMVIDQRYLIDLRAVDGDEGKFMLLVNDLVSDAQKGTE